MGASGACALSTPHESESEDCCHCRLKQYEIRFLFQVKLPTCANQGVFELPERTQTCVVDCRFCENDNPLLQYLHPFKPYERKRVGSVFCSGSESFSIGICGGCHEVFLTVKDGKELLALWAVANQPWWVVRPKSHYA